MRFPLLTAAIALTPLLCHAARADAAPQSKVAKPKSPKKEAKAETPLSDNLTPSAPEAGELWKSAPLAPAPSKTIDQSQVAEAATQQFSVVAGLREWRDTLDGRGKFATRDLLKGELLGSDAKFTLGRVAPPSIAGVGGNAGVAAQWGNLEIGSTLRPRELDEALIEFDRGLTGKKGQLADAQNVTWLRARPVQGKDGELELNVARAARDIAKGDAVKMREGTFVGAQGDLKLPLRWKLGGQYARAMLDEADEAKASWNTKLNGPLVHPLGEARAELEWRETDAGFATLGQSDANGGTAGAARVTQEIQTDWLSGQLKLAATQRERHNLGKARVGETLENRDASGAADLKLKVTPNLSLRAAGALGAAQVVRAGEGFAASLQAGEGEAPLLTEETHNQGGDVGVEWKLDDKLALAATVGTSQTLGWRDETSEAPVWTPFGQSEENRIGFEVRHRDKAGLLLAKYATRARDDESLADWQRLETLRLQAQRPLGFGMKVNTIVDLARGGDASWSDESSVARRVEAQLQFNRAARVDLKFRDGAALPGSWLSDPLSAPFRPTGGASWNAGDKEFGARINAGSAAGGQGFGLALEYARQESAGRDNDQWRVGLTWK